MLARTFFVRKLKPVDKETYDADPAAYQGEMISDPTGDVGEAVCEHMFPLQNPNPQPGQPHIDFVPLLGIIWSKNVRPCMTYENPALVENVDDIIEAHIEERVEERLAAADAEDEEEDDKNGN